MRTARGGPIHQPPRAGDDDLQAVEGVRQRVTTVASLGHDLGPARSRAGAARAPGRDASADRGDAHPASRRGRSSTRRRDGHGHGSGASVGSRRGAVVQGWVERRGPALGGRASLIGETTAAVNKCGSGSPTSTGQCGGSPHRGHRDLSAGRPRRVAAYIRTHPGSVPTVKQYLAADRAPRDLNGP